MLSKPVKILLGLVVAIVLLAGAFSGGLLVGVALPAQAASALPFKDLILPGMTVEAGSTFPESDTLFRPFRQAWELMHEYYVEQPLDDEVLMQGAIRGMLDSVGDPHTSYMNPEEYRQINTSLMGKYEGIGAYVDIRGDFVKIISPMPDSPAEKAGLRPGDIVIKVDGDDMTGVDGNLVLNRILGPAGTKVTLTIVREGEEKPFDVTITRAAIKVSSVEGKMLESDVAYIAILTYGDNTTDEVHKALVDLLAKKPKGLIVDLRYNTGGFLEAAIDIVSEFIPKGTVMYEEYGDGTRKTFEARGGGVAYEIPLVILVNEGSASASEITAGAVQDLGRGKLVGVTTYGKGSVQNWVELKDDQGAVHITTARWLTPKERQINDVGLEPDYIVEITEEDYEADRDPQLDKAVELLTK
ncbi:MAG: S41 family peptidase [Anaerolineaceae bacterium]